MNDDLKERLAQTLARFKWSLDDPNFEVYFAGTRGAWLKQVDAIFAELAAAGYAVVSTWPDKREIDKLVGIFGHTRDHTRAFREAMIAAAEQEQANGME